MRSDTPHVVALCGSLRETSRTRIALGAALDATEQTGARTELLDLREYDLPSRYAGEDGDAEELRQRVDRADSVLLGTPNYHGSYSGALKDALDHCGREEFEATTVGLLEVAAGDFPGSALGHLRTVSRTLRAWTLPRAVAIPDSRSLVEESGITDPDIAARTERLGRDLAEYAGVANYPNCKPQDRGKQQRSETR